MYPGHNAILHSPCLALALPHRQPLRPWLQTGSQPPWGNKSTLEIPLLKKALCLSPSWALGVTAEGSSSPHLWGFPCLRGLELHCSWGSLQTASSSAFYLSIILFSPVRAGESHVMSEEGLWGMQSQTGHRDCGASHIWCVKGLGQRPSVGLPVPRAAPSGVAVDPEGLCLRAGKLSRPWEQQWPTTHAGTPTHTQPQPPGDAGMASDCWGWT